jgi:hypothetical protein
MVKVVHHFNSCLPIFLFEFLELWNLDLDRIKVGSDLEFKLNFKHTRAHLLASPSPPSVARRYPSSCCTTPLHTARAMACPLRRLQQAGAVPSSPVRPSSFPFIAATLELETDAAGLELETNAPALELETTLDLEMVIDVP